MLSIALVVTMALAVAAPALAAFSDTTTHWARQAIDRMNARGVITGYEDGRFLPDRAVSRLEALVMLVRFMGLENAAQATDKIPSSFEHPDLVPAWGRGYVAVGVDRGILKGADLTNFNGGAAAQRGDLAVWLLRALGLESEALAAAGQALPFADAAAIPTDIRGYVYVANQRGFITGFTDNTFQARGPVTRAQIATILARADRQGLGGFGARTTSGSVVSVDAPLRTVVVRPSTGADMDLVVAATAPVYGPDGRPLLLTELAPGTQVEALRNELGTVVYLEVAQPGATPPPGTGSGSDTPPPAGEQVSGSGFVYRVSAGSVQIIGSDGRLRTFYLTSSTSLREKGATVARSRLQPGYEVSYAATGDTLTSLNLGDRVTFYDGRATRVEATATHRLIIFDYWDDRGRRLGGSVTVPTTAAITREGAAVSLGDVRHGDQVIIQVRNSQAASVTAFQWRKVYEGTLDALLFAPDPRLRVRTAGGLVELALPEDPEDVKYTRVSGDEEVKIGLLDLAAGDQVTVVSQGGRITDVTVERAAGSAGGTVRRIEIGDDIRLVLAPEEGGADRTYTVARDVRVEAGGRTGSLLDVRAGARVELQVSGGVVTRIVVADASTTEEFRGRVLYVYGSVAIIEPDDDSGSFRQVELDGVIVRGTRVSTRLSDLEVGDRVLVVGTQRGARFTATNIVVLSSN